MRVLDLFAGLRGWSQPFADRGHDVFSVDLDERFDVSLHADILTLTPDDLPWKPDIILASPPCESFSVMTIGRNWAPGKVPKTDKARLAIELVKATRRLIDEVAPAYFVVENPRAMLRKLPMLADLERRTVTYCQYGMPYMKPTDLWGGFPPSLVMRPMCRPGSTCHVAAARGSRTGVQGGSDTRTAENPWKRRDGTFGPRYSSFGGEGSVAFEQVLYWSSDPRRKDASARVAMVPAELGRDVCLAAERDLAAGAVPIPTSLWAVA